MTDATDAFGHHAAHYDAERRALIPPFEHFYDTAIEALQLAGRPVRRVLDLGAGTGLLSRRVLEALPATELTLLDGAAAMLEQARASLGDRADYVVADLRAPLPEGPWDAVVSALAIHHLADADKAALFRRVHEVLMPGGVFVNAEQVAGPSAVFADRYCVWHREQALARGASVEAWEASAERQRLDRWATVGAQSAWLRDAGFPDVDCLMKDHGFAVIVARRAG